jgi:hypothetical protein
MHDSSVIADALPASFAKLLYCGGEIFRVAKAVLLTVLASCGWTHVAQVVLDDSAASMVSMSTRGNHPIVACAGRFSCMGASPLRLSFYQPYPHRPPNRAGPKRKRIPLVERCIGPAATRGSRVTSRISAHESRPAQSAERDPVLSQNPADNRIDLACPIQSETAPNNFGDHLSTHFLLTPSTPKCSAESCRCHRRTSAI